ncbi:MAG: RcnB family protein [Pseudoxanthomonas sp.]
MNNLLKIGATSLLLLGVAAAPAFASDRDHDRDRDQRGQHYGYSRDHRNDGNRNDRNQGRRDYDTAYSQGYRSAPARVVYRQPQRVYVQPRQVYVRQSAPWRRGGYYRGYSYAPTYVVNDYDYGYYGLDRPPRGYGWRRSDTGDFLLVALATGIIADIILNH